MEIKTTLKQLFELFASYTASAVAEGVPVQIRRFAAQLTVLTAHVRRIDDSLNQVAALVHELANLMVEVRKGAPAAAEAPAAGAPTTTPAATSSEAPPPMDEEDEARAMADKVIQETEAELQALSKNGSPEPPPVTPIRKAPSAGGAA